MRGCFVTGTDTGAGKTVVAAAIAAALTARGERVAAFKPVITGVGAPARAGDWPLDHQLLAAVTGGRADDVVTAKFAPAVAPHLAAELAGVELHIDELAAAARAAAGAADVIVVEGIGGLLVPLSWRSSVRDLAVELGLPLVIAARPGLGTINHSLLTIESARAAGLDVRAVVMTPWPDEPGELERSNRDSVARLGEVVVATLPIVTPTAAALARAGATLPLSDWLGSPRP